MKKYKIGYTTGVYDLFHIGHLNILKKSKEQCDYLVVGVSTDELVEEYKSKKPIISYDERAAIVKSIKYVDEVVPQTSMNKKEAWERIKFDALFHGDDWKGSNLYNKYEKDFEGLGVEFIFLPHTDGTSSTKITKILNKILAEDKESDFFK